MITLNGLVERAHQIAKDKGWWEKVQPWLVYHALFTSEVAEATEEVRQGTPPIYQMQPEWGLVVPTRPEGSWWRDDIKPCGEAIELADVIIRIADYFGARGWDLEQAVELKQKYNETRAYRHGGKLF